MTDAIRNWAEAVQSVTSAMPAPSVRLADKLPDPSELVSNAYAFAEQLLIAQRKFAGDVIAATTPALGGVGDAAARKAGSADQ